MKDAPEIIYLQVCEDDDCDTSFSEHEGVTWCHEQINPSDIKYVRADTLPQLPLSEKLLTEAFNNVAQGELKKVVREWIVFTAPKEVHDVIAEYTRLLAEQETRP